MDVTRLTCITLESSLSCNVEANASLEDIKHVPNKSR